MARSRNIKPSFFINEKLAELSFSTRLLFIGLWTMCDRLGRMEDRPKRIKMNLFPADRVDVERGLVELAKAGFITRYVVDGERFIEVPNFVKHQTPHVKEAASTIPAPDKPGASTRQAPVEHPLNPDSLQSDSPKELREATAPPPTPPKTADARRSHPAITALHEVTGIYPPKEIWDEVIDRLGVDVDIGRLKTCYAKWRARGYAKGNYTGIIDWYHDGIPEPNGNGKPKPNSNYREQREQEAIRDRAVIDAARARTAARQLSRRDAGYRERQLLGSGPDPDPG